MAKHLLRTLKCGAVTTEEPSEDEPAEQLDVSQQWVAKHLPRPEMLPAVVTEEPSEDVPAEDEPAEDEPGARRPSRVSCKGPNT